MTLLFIVSQNKLPSPFLTEGDRSKNKGADTEMQSPTDGMLETALTNVFLSTT